MPRPLRPIADGLIHHIINRGAGVTELPQGSDTWVRRLSKQQELGLAIRLRGRPKKEVANKKSF